MRAFAHLDNSLRFTEQYIYLKLRLVPHMSANAKF